MRMPPVRNRQGSRFGKAVRRSVRMNRKPTLFFDYDGTIHETMRIYQPAILEITESLKASGYAVEIPSDERIAGWLGMTTADMWQDFCPDLPETVRNAAGKRVGEIMADLTRAGQAAWYPETAEILTELKDLGYSMAILSNCSGAYAKMQWQAFHMEQWFFDFYFSEHYGWIAKPEILKLLTVNREEEYPPVMIGDRETDILSGHAAGGKSIGCLYGYGSKEELQTADFLVKNIRDLPTVVTLLERKMTEETKK